MKTMIKSIVAALAVVVGLNSWAATEKTMNFEGETSFTATNPTYVNDSGDDLNRKTPGWYWGATITWPYETSGIGTKRYGSTISNAKHVLTRNGVEVFNDTASLNWSNDYGLTADVLIYIASTTWNAWITPEEAYAANGGNVVQTLKLSGANSWISGFSTVNATVPETTFTMTFPTANLTLTDNDGVKWFPAVALIGEKVYGDFDVAFKAGGEIKAVDNVTLAGTYEVAEDSSLVLKLGGHTMTVTGSLSLKGGTYDFDPSEYVAKGYTTTKEGATWTVVLGHTHSWTYANANGVLTATCGEPLTCTVEGAEIAVSINVAGRDFKSGETISATIDNAAAFEAATGLDVADAVTFWQGENQVEAPYYTGSYTAKLVVGEYTLAKNFSITKPAAGYTDGWEVNNTPTSVRYDSWDEAIAAAKDGDTVIYYHEQNRDFETHEYSVGDKNIVIDFGGATLKRTKGMSGMTIKNTGSGTVTFQNVEIQQPMYGLITYQITAEGNIRFGTGVKVTNLATLSDRYYCTITSTSGTLEVTDGLYQCSLVADGGSVVVSGGKYWENFKPSDFLKEGYEVRELTEGDYKYEVFGHAHSFKYTAEGNVITLVCEGDNAEDCPYNTKSETLTLTAENAKYTGVAYAGAKVEATDKFADGGAEIGEIEYWTAADPSVKQDAAPVAEGSYIAKVTAGGATAEAAFAITHVHLWKFEASGAAVTATCTNAVSDCAVPGRTVTMTLTVTGGSDGVEPTFALANKDDFLAKVNEDATTTSVGDITYVRTTDDGAAAANWYVGSYTASCVVTANGEELTLTQDFTIAKGEQEYAKGYAVASRDIRYNTWGEALAAATDGDTVYYRDGTIDAKDLTDRVIEFSVDKDITLNLGGATLKQTAYFYGSSSDDAIGMTIKNAGNGTLTLVNGVIQQPHYGTDTVGVSTQVEIAGNIVFGADMSSVNQASNEERYLTLYVTSGKLEVTAGEYQNGYVADGGTVEVSGGKFWANDDPSTFVKTGYAVREIAGDYKYEVFGHTHSFKYTVADNVITLVCEGVESTADCPYNTKSETLTLTAENAKYTGVAYAGAKVEATDKFADGGAQIGAIEYWAKDGVEPLAEAPVAEGYYIAKVTAGGVTATQEFTITHDHKWDYAADGDTITATCTNTPCILTEKPTAKIVVENKVFTGAKQTPATVTKDDNFEGEITVSYSADPIAVGTYTAYAKIGEATAEATFEITVANIGGITAEMATKEFDFTAQEIENTLGSAKFGDYNLASSGDYEISGITKAFGSGYSNETYDVILTGAGNFNGTKTVTWTIKAPTRSFADDAFATTSTLVFDQTAQAWVTTSTLAWPCPSGSISTWTQFTALEKSVFTVGGETFFGNDAKNGITCSAESKTLDQKYNIIEGATWKINSTAAELDAAQGGDVDYTMTACGLVWGDKFGLISYGDTEGIRATDFVVTIPTMDLALELPADATYDLGAAKLEYVKIRLGVGAKVTTTVEQNEDQIYTTETGYNVVKTEDGSVYTYTTDLKPITITVNPLEHANVTVKVGEKAIETIGNNQYVVSYGNTVTVTYTANEKGWKPSPQVKTLENVTTEQEVSGEEMKYFHDHLFKFEKDGTTLTATCTNTETTCALEDRQVALTLKVADKTFDGSAVVATLENEDAFTNATLAAVGEIKYYAEDDTEISAPVNVGTYKAQVLVAPGDIDGIVLEKQFTISAKKVSATVTLDKNEVIETGSDITVGITSITDGTTTFASTDYDATGTFTAKARGDYTITVTFKGNYEGSATAKWSIIEPTGAFSETAATIKSGDPAYGTIEGNVLTIDDASKLVYSEGTWSAAMTITWPWSATYGKLDYTKTFPLTVQYTDETHAKMVVTDGTTANTTKNGRYYEGAILGNEYTYVESTTWTVSVTKDSLKAAPVDEEGYACFTNTMSSVAWGTTTAGNVTGIRDTDFIIRIKPGDLEKDISAATTELVASYNYDFTEKVNSLGTVKYGDATLVENKDYTVDASSVFKGTGNGKTDENFTVIINGIGDFKGTKTMTWVIKAPETALEDNEATAGGELVGTTLWMTNGSNYGWTYYAAENAPDGSGIAGFYAGIQIKWPNSTRYTDLEHGYFKVNGSAWQNATQTIPGLTFSKLGEIFKYIHEVTFWQRLTIDELKAAEGETLTKTMTAIGLVWGKSYDIPIVGEQWYGDKVGVKETDFAIVTKLAGLELYDAEGWKVWPEHEHEWVWTTGDGSVLTAACTEAGCKYKANPLALTIAPTTVAEKYCDTTPLTATVTGGDELAAVTGATVGEVEYFEDEEELGAAPTLPGEYTAQCTVVSKDEATTNTIATTLRILTGQAICNGIHVADAAEYFEKKTQDAMTIYVGKDFTAAQTYVVPANWKAGTFTEYEMTLEQFIQNVRDGKYGDLYSWDDVRNLIAGKTTLQELFQRLKTISEDFTLIDCGTKTIDLSGFTVTAADGLPLFWNQGTLILKGEGTLTVGEEGGETLIVNDGTLSIEAGTYVGSITNAGSLVISGGYFTGAILNGDGTVVLTGGAYEIEPDEDFVPSGYDLVERDGIWYVEKHEHKYTFLPLGRCMMSCTCWNWFVDDSDQWIQFSHCNAHKLGIFIATRDTSTGVLPQRKYSYTGKPVEANVVGYNFQAIAKIGILKNISELVDIAEEAEDADENWDEMTAIEKFQTMMSILNSIEDLDLDFTDLIWDAADIENETGLKFGAIKYYDAKTDEELEGAPVESGSYKACVVITTPKGNEVTRTWKFAIGTDYTTDFEDWLEEIGDSVKNGWSEFKQNIRDTFDRLPTEEEVEEYFDELDQKHREYFENLKEKGEDIDQKIIDAHKKMVDKLKDTYQAAKNWTDDADEKIRAAYENHKTNADALVLSWRDAITNDYQRFCDEVEEKTGNWPTRDEIDGFFDELDQKHADFFKELKAKGEAVDQKIIDAHDDMVQKLRATDKAIATWTTDTIDKIAALFEKDEEEEEAEEEESPAPEMPMLMMATASNTYEEFSEEIEEETGSQPTLEDVKAYFDELDKKVLQFFADVKKQGTVVDQKIIDAYNDALRKLRDKKLALTAWTEDADEKIRAAYEQHCANADQAVVDAYAAITNDFQRFCDEVEAKTGELPTWQDVRDYFDGLDVQVAPFFRTLKAKGEEADQKIIGAYDEMVACLKEKFADADQKIENAYETVRGAFENFREEIDIDWMNAKLVQMSDNELQIVPDAAKIAPVWVTLNAEDKVYDGGPASVALDGADKLLKFFDIELDGPFYRPIDDEGNCGEEIDPPVMPGYYEIFYKLFKANAEIKQFVLRHKYYIQKLREEIVEKEEEVHNKIMDYVDVYFVGGKTNFVYNAGEQGPKIWGVYCGLDKLVEGADYVILEGGVTNATKIGEYEFTIKGRGFYELYEKTFTWSITEPTGTFKEGAFQIRSELEYNAEAKTWDTVATLDWPRNLEQVIRAPRYYTVDYAEAETTANFTDATVEPMVKEFYRIRTGAKVQYVAADIWTLPFTAEQLTEAAQAGYTAITNTLTAYAIGSESAPEGMAKTNFEYVVDIEGLELYDDEGRKCYPIHTHDWQFSNDEDGTLKADCYIKSCPVSHVEVSVAAESKDWDETPVRAAIADVANQFAIHTRAKYGEIRYADESGDLESAPVEPGAYTAYASVVVGAVTNKVWKNYEIRTIDLSNATVQTEPDKTEFVYSEAVRTLKVNAVIVNGRLLLDGEDYAVTGTTSATEVGDYVITITGIGRYFGTRTISWKIVEPTREYAADAFKQDVGEDPAYGTIEGKTLTITASTNLYYDVTTSNWYAAVTVDWPYDMGGFAHAPQYTVPAKAYVEVATPTATNDYTALDITEGKTENDDLTADIGEFYSVRYVRNEQYVKRIGWDIAITLADIKAAREEGLDEIVYTITVGSPAGSTDSDGLAKTTYTIVLPIDEKLILLDEKGERAYPEPPSGIKELKKQLEGLGDVKYELDDDGEVTNVTITLIGDVPAERTPLVIPEDLGLVTLDLNGMKITGPDGNEDNIDGKPAIIVGEDSELDIIGMGEVKGGNGLEADPPGLGAKAVTGAYQAGENVTIIDGNTPVIEIPLTFTNAAIVVEEGDDVVLTIRGGNRFKPARAQLSIVYQTAAAADLDFKASGFTLPMTIEWPAGVMGETNITICTKTDRTTEGDEKFTMRLAGLEKMPEGEILACEVTIKDATEKSTSMRVTEPKEKTTKCVLTVAADDPNGGFIPDHETQAYWVGSKVSLNAQARTGYAFNGWQVVESFTGGEDVTTVYPRTSCSFTLSGTNAVATALFSDIAYVRALADPSDIAKTTGSGYCATGKRVTLSYSVNSSYKYDGASKPIDTRSVEFLGWYEADEDGQCSDVLVTTCKQIVFDRTAKPYAPTATRYVITNDLACTTFFAKFKTPNRVIIANPKIKGKVAGTVSGDGYYASNKVVTVRATAKTGYVFAGWYDDSTHDEIKPEMAGEESELFITKDASFKLTVTKPLTELRAVFVTKEEDAANVKLTVNGAEIAKDVAAGSANANATNLMAGVAVDWDVFPAGLTATTVSASGLPSGLKLTQDRNTKEYSIVGAPTATKPTTYSPKLTVTTAGRTRVVFQLNITVEPLAGWAYGTFNGGSDTNMVTLTVSSAGKISGTLNRDGQRWTLSATSYAKRDGDLFCADLIAKCGKEQEEMAVIVGSNRVDTTVETVRGYMECDQWQACQNIWKAEPWKTLATALRNKTTTKDGVTLKVGTAGAVTATYEKLTCSTVLLPHADDDGEFTNSYDVVVYFVKSGEVVYSKVLADVTFVE